MLLGPSFVDPKAPLLGLAVGTGPRRARARVLSLGSTRDPYRWARQGGLWINKSGSQGLTAMHPPTLRAPNPFPALVCPNSNLLNGFWAENLKM